MNPRSLRWVILAIVMFASGVSLGEPPPPSSRPVWEIEILSLDNLTSARVETEQAMTQWPADVKESSPEGLMRSVLKARLSLLLELEDSLKRQKVLKETAPALIAADAEVSGTIVKSRKSQEVKPPDNPTNEAFDALREKLKVASGKLEELKREARERADIMQGLSDRITKTRDRQREAQRNEEKFRNLL
ncbi:MAG: hypothetical protein HQL73_10245, partial [Magnetococcales bacterium]|nr:hypothetical protein [Magnetococcales bacterium]